MGSNIRGIKDLRWGPRTHPQRRDNTNGVPAGDHVEKILEHGFTGHKYTSQFLPGEPSNTDAKVDAVHELLVNQLAPRIQSKSANAVTVDRRNFYLMKRRRSGRRCSCWKVETSADSGCPVCYGIGIVGGFEKFGTISETLDYTTPNLIMVNVEPNLADDTRPVYLKLKDDQDFGYVEADFEIKANVGVIDTLFLYQPIFNRGTKVYAISNTIPKTQIVNPDDLEPFLKGNVVTIRVEFERLDAKPIISNYIFRYKTRHDIIVFGDIPRAEESVALTEIGQVDTYSQIGIFFDGKRVRRIEFEDLLYRLEDGRRFKIVSTKENRIAGVLTSTDVMARYCVPDIDTGYMRVLI